MCGIAGIVVRSGRADPPPEALERMCATLRHRGPDEAGSGVREGVALAMRRLSIIDVAGGHQPLLNEDATVRAIFNGEIYNFAELRRELEAKGHRFRSRSDGEVLPHLWEEHGRAFPRRLNGMFAIALHDARRRRFVLVRDRVGIKPLYWTADAERLLFGSEIKAILASGLVERRLDLDALREFLAWEYVPAPRTLFAGIRKLEPGHLLEVDLDDLRFAAEPYWDVPPPGEGGEDRRRPAADWAEAVDAALRTAVRRRLVSDVPLGAFLSGGVDSSLIAAHMGGARTFSIGFDDPSYNELGFSRRVADHLGVSHRTEVLRPDVVELFGRLMHFLDDPIGDFSIFPTYLVSRLAREEVTVVLSGDGGDELFGGYETYAAEQLARAWSRIPSPLRRGLAEPLVRRLRPRPAKKGLVNKAKRFVEGLDHDAALGHARWRCFLSRALGEALFTPEARERFRAAPERHVLELAGRAAERPEIDRALYVDLRSYLADNILVKVDRMSMAVSLEARVPYLDHEVVELAFRVPPELKVRARRTKPLLKDVAARHVPRECVDRPKEGFSIPIKNWLSREFRPLLDELLAPERLRREGIFEPSVVERLRREHFGGRENHSHLLWALLVFEDWRRRWKA